MAYYHIFPFGHIPQNSQIILYGMGEVGHQYLEQILETRYCRIQFTVDKNYKKIKVPDGIKIRDVSAIEDETFDFIVIAIASPDALSEIERELLNLKTVTKEKIIYEDKICRVAEHLTVPLDSALKRINLNLNKIIDSLSENQHAVGMRWDLKLQERLASTDRKFLEGYGFQVYSQNDEDGIIEEIFHRIGCTNKMFVEFGVQDGLENNTHYLLLQGWSGLWIEGDARTYKEILKNFSRVIQTNRLKVLHEFATVENINSLIEGNIKGEIDLLSIDIDGNDYHVWKAIDVISPRVVVIEYNAKFPPSCNWAMRYDEQHIWDGTDCFGASLNMLMKLGEEKGYQLVGTNIRGVNAFFVRKDLTKDLFVNEKNAEIYYNPPRYFIHYKSGHRARYFLNND